ncbi:MAG: hypothetical protein M3467_01535 [Actinomycetota bacterium]|nr:hypothetical protein [Actinomycetota bacterium]
MSVDGSDSAPSSPQDATGGASGTPFSPQDEALLEALAAGHSARNAGAVVGVSERSVVRRKSNPDFAARLEARKAEIASERIAVIQGLRDSKLRLAAQADQALADLLSHDDPAIRLAAAKQLTAATQSLGQLDIQVRLAELERQIAESAAEGWAAPSRWPE